MLLAIAALATLLWLLAMRLGYGSAAPAPDAAAGLPAEQEGAPPAVQAYSTFVKDSLTRGMAADHHHTARAVAGLASAIREIVAAEPASSAALERRAGAFYAIADMLVASPDSLRVHADWLSRTAVAATEMMERIGDTRFAGDVAVQAELREVRRAAEAISPGRDLAAQEESVTAFFREAAEALRLLARSPAAAAGT